MWLYSGAKAQKQAFPWFVLSNRSKNVESILKFFTVDITQALRAGKRQRFDP